MKKIIKYSIAIWLVLVAVTGCQDYDPAIVDFEKPSLSFSYSTEEYLSGNEGDIDFVIKQNIVFQNTSATGTTWEWDFGDGSPVSSEKNPIHKYTEPGTYNVRLTADGNKSISKRIMISDLVPRVSYTSDDEVLIFKKSQVQFDVKILNPDNEKITYTWKFPEGTIGSNINSEGVYVTEYDPAGSKQPVHPKVVFAKIGSQRSVLNIKVGEKDLTPVNVSVKVGYNNAVKTLYYAAKDGNIMAKKIIEGEDAALSVSYDLGITSGKHPLNMHFYKNNLIIFDAGTVIAYADPSAGKGNGEIFMVAKDGSKRESIIDNYAGDTFEDFYYGWIDEATDMIYWADRREGVCRISANSRNVRFTRSSFPYIFKNNRLGFYGNGIGFGAQNSTFYKRGEVWWWAKHTLGSGIFRFKDADIQPADVTAGAIPAPADGYILGDYKIRSFIIDEEHQNLYFASQFLISGRPNRPAGIYKVAMTDFGDKNKHFNIDASMPIMVGAAEGSSAETLFVTQFVIDYEGGYLYWAYRSEDPTKSGIKRYKLDGTKPVEYFIEGVNAYCITINQQPTQLF